MLILSRREGESIMIGDDIEVVVTRIDHDSVRLGVNAPRKLAVFRNEIYRKIQESNMASVREASGAGPVLPALPALALRPKPSVLPHPAPHSGGDPNGR
ncbi:MAG: carbon storage regulator CsrA [Verrucomicrobiota bacterium]|jgi:carbon storage regulator